jgi:Pyridoxamine 5'-phosphate oxidase
MKSWNEFCQEVSELADLGKRMLFQNRAQVGLGFLATLRKDGAPRLHPVSLVLCSDHLYVFIPARSPKCGDLKRDGRYALQAFPIPEDLLGKEFCISGVAKVISSINVRQFIIAETKIHVEDHEILFELFFDRAMYTELVNIGTSNERAYHRIWPTSRRDAESE